MKRLFLKTKSKQNNTPQSDQDALLSPNLLSQDLLEQGTLSPTQKAFITICKIFTLVILGVFFITLATYFLKARSYEKRLFKLNTQVQDLALYLPTEKRVNNLNKRIVLHKKVAPERKNFVDKVSATLSEIGTDENLRNFDYKDGVLTVKITRDDILTTTLLLSKLIEQEYVDEIAIVSADLNASENYYTIRLEITYK